MSDFDPELAKTSHIDGEELSRVCWVAVHSARDHLSRAKEEKDEWEALGETVTDETEEKWGEFQYHAGMHNGYDDMIQQLETTTIDVEGRAEQYAEENDLPLGEPYQ